MKRFLLLIILKVSVLLTACGSNSFRFAEAGPVREINDREPIPLPKPSKYIRADYYYEVLVRRPTLSLMEYSSINRSRDVNSFDQLPASSWYIPRLGYQTISPEELLKGPQKIGPPQPPVRVVRAKHLGSDPGFVIADSRDRLYLIKFDPPAYPALETTTAFIVNRLFWGFGYNVPEDYIFYFNSAEVPVDPTADITEDEVKLVFNTIAPPDSGIYRATASLLLEGIYLGPIGDVGVRKDDPNDRFSHEDRRILRALKVFGAFTNQTNIRIDNSLDVYVGEAGKGYVKHYLLDFGEAFGGYGAETGEYWSGFSHTFSFGEFFENFYTLGLKSQEWENLRPTPWKSVNGFEAEYFDPANWKEAYPFEPVRRARPDDNYWAAKIVASFTREHIAALVEEANYPEPGAGEYIIQTLIERRQKIIDYYFSQVSPLEPGEFSGGKLTLEDYGKRYMRNLDGETRYEIHFYNDSKKQIAPGKWLTGSGSTLEILITPELLRSAKHYLRLEVRVWRGETAAPRSAYFHIRSSRGGTMKLVGIVH
jgi:hypothetical protein